MESETELKAKKAVKKHGALVRINRKNSWSTEETSDNRHVGINKSDI